jgi:uncharacterized membrane protein YbaN (DUF454 family)
METTANPRTSAQLLILAGCLFLAAAVIGLIARQFSLLAFFGIGAAFLAIGATKLRKRKQPAP